MELKTINSNLIKKLNYEKSMSMYDTHWNNIKLHQCYNNVFNVVLHSFNIFEDYHIGYGYMLNSTLFLLSRHCFFIDKNTGEIVDPTIPLLIEKEKPIEYVIFEIFTGNDDYLEMIKRNNNWVTNKDSKKEIDFYIQNIQDTIFSINEFDFYTYIIDNKFR